MIALFGNWHRYFCQFRKKDIASKKIKQAKFTPIGHRHQAQVHEIIIAKALLLVLPRLSPTPSTDPNARFCGSEGVCSCQDRGDRQKVLL